MRKSFKLPEKLEKGDKIALVGIGDGPSKQEYPKHFERGKKRLEEVFNLEPVEFPSVRMSRTEKRKNLGKRAEDLEDAFRDDEIKGVLAPVGGSDQIKLLNHINPEVLKENPTRFYGYSDNTVLNSFLWKHGIVSFQGPMLMNDLSKKNLSEYTVKHCSKAFFKESIGEISHSDKIFNSSGLEEEEKTAEHPGLKFCSGKKPVRGRIWGGCLNTLKVLLQADKAVPDKNEVDGGILAIETAENPLPHNLVGRFLTGLGERGLLENFSGVIVGLPKTRCSWRSLDTKEEMEEYREHQRKRIQDKIEKYSPGTPVVFNVNFGHINPMTPLPIGGEAEIRPERKELILK